MKYKRHATIAMIFLLGLALIFFIIRFNHDKAKKPVAVAPNVERKINFSRITFFNASKHRASLAIPDFWEGKYRVREEGNTVVFLDISDPNLPSELFRISARDSKVSETKGENPGWEEIGRVDGTVFYFQLSTANGKKTEGFDRMQTEAKDFMKSFMAT